MPKTYEIELDDGRVVEIESDFEPSEQDVMSALESHSRTRVSKPLSTNASTSKAFIPDDVGHHAMPIAPPDELGVGEEVRGLGRSFVRSIGRFSQQGDIEAMRLAVREGLPSDVSLQQGQSQIDQLRNELSDINAQVRGKPLNLETRPLHERKIAILDQLSGKSGSLYGQVLSTKAGQQAARDYAISGRALDKLPQTQAQKEFFKKETPWWHFFKNPVELSTTTMAESAPVLAQTVAAAPAGPVGVAAAAGGASFGAESSARVTKYMQDAGVDVNNPEAVWDWFSDRAKSDPALAKADLAALGPAAFDSLTGGLAGQLIKRAIGKGILKVGAATAGEMGIQMAGGGLGSVAGSSLAGEDVDWKDVVLEMAAEIAPVEAVSNLAAERARGGVQDASQDRKAAPVYGDVRPRQGQQEVARRIAELESDPEVTGKTFVRFDEKGNPVFEENIKNTRKVRELERLKAQQGDAGQRMADAFNKQQPVSEAEELRALQERFIRGQSMDKSEIDRMEQLRERAAQAAKPKRKSKPAMSPEEEAYLRMEQEGMESEFTEAAKKHGYEGEVEFLSDDELGDDDSLRSGVAQWNTTTKTIQVNRDAWNALSETQKQEALEPVMLEEAFHSRTSDNEALKFFENTPWLQRVIREKIYTQGLDVGKIPDWQLGHEMMRMAFQRLSGVTLTEKALRSGTDRWTVEALDVMDRAIESTRQFLGTKASKRQTALLNRAQKNIGIARQFAQSGALQSLAPQTADDLLDKPMGTHGPEAIAAMPDAAWDEAMNRKKGERWSMTADATAWAMNQPPSKEMAERLEAMAKQDFEQAIAKGSYPMKFQWYLDAAHVLKGSEVGKNNIETVRRMEQQGRVSLAKPQRGPLQALNPNETAKQFNLTYDGKVGNRHQFTIQDEGPANLAQFTVPESATQDEVAAKKSSTIQRFSGEGANLQALAPRRSTRSKYELEVDLSNPPKDPVKWAAWLRENFNKARRIPDEAAALDVGRQMLREIDEQAGRRADSPFMGIPEEDPDLMWSTKDLQDQEFADYYKSRGLTDEQIDKLREIHDEEDRAETERTIEAGNIDMMGEEDKSMLDPGYIDRAYLERDIDRWMRSRKSKPDTGEPYQGNLLAMRPRNSSWYDGSVLAKNGTPVTVFHGSPEELIRQGELRSPIFVATDKKLATGHTGVRETKGDLYSRLSRYGRVYPAHIKFSNPMEWTEDGGIPVEEAKRIFDTTDHDAIVNLKNKEYALRSQDQVMMVDDAGGPLQSKMTKKQARHIEEMRKYREQMGQKPVEEQGPAPGSVSRRQAPASSRVGADYFFPKPTPESISQTGQDILSDQTALPSFQRFLDHVRSKHGDVKSAQVAEAWADQVWSFLEKATGAELESLVDRLGLRRQVFGTFRQGRKTVSGEAAPAVSRSGRIADAGTDVGGIDTAKRKAMARATRLSKMAAKMMKSALAPVSEVVRRRSPEDYKRQLELKTELKQKAERLQWTADNLVVAARQQEGMPATQMLFEGEQEKVKPDSPHDPTRGSESRRRDRAIAIIGRHLLNDRPSLTAGLNRSELGPEDVRWEETGADIKKVSPEDLQDLDSLGLELTTNAATDASTQRIAGGGRFKVKEKALPRSATKRVIAMRDNRTGAIYLVSGYRDGYRGPVFRDPHSITGQHRGLEQLVNRFTPLFSVPINIPVQNFLQKFDNEKAFHDRFEGRVEKMGRRIGWRGLGTEPPIEGSEGMEGEGGFVQGPEADLARIEAGMAQGARESGAEITPEEARAIYEVFSPMETREDIAHMMERLRNKAQSQREDVPMKRSISKMEAQIEDLRVQLSNATDKDASAIQKKIDDLSDNRNKAIAKLGLVSQELTPRDWQFITALTKVNDALMDLHSGEGKTAGEIADITLQDLYDITKRNQTESSFVTSTQRQFTEGRGIPREAGAAQARPSPTSRELTMPYRRPPTDVSRAEPGQPQVRTGADPNAPAGLSPESSPRFRRRAPTYETTRYGEMFPDPEKFAPKAGTILDYSHQHRPEGRARVEGGHRVAEPTSYPASGRADPENVHYEMPEYRKRAIQDRINEIANRQVQQQQAAAQEQAAPQPSPQQEMELGGTASEAGPLNLPREKGPSQQGNLFALSRFQVRKIGDSPNFWKNEWTSFSVNMRVMLGNIKDQIKEGLTPANAPEVKQRLSGLESTLTGLVEKASQSPDRAVAHDRLSELLKDVQATKAKLPEGVQGNLLALRRRDFDKWKEMGMRAAAGNRNSKASGVNSQEYQLPYGMSYDSLWDLASNYHGASLTRLWDVASKLMRMNPELSGLNLKGVSEASERPGSQGDRYALFTLLGGVASKFKSDNIKFFINDLKGSARTGPHSTVETGVTQVTPPSENQSRPEEGNLLALRRNPGRTVGERAQNVLRDALSIYDRWMVDRIDEYGGRFSKDAARRFRHIIDRQKDLYGSLTPTLDRARRLSGGIEPGRPGSLGQKLKDLPRRTVESAKAMRAAAWLNRLNTVTPDTAVANSVGAMEFNLPVPSFAQPLVDASRASNLEIGRMLQPVSPGFLATGKFQRNLTGLGYDILRSGGGPIWDKWTRGVWRANRITGRTLGDVRNYFKKVKVALDDPLTSGTELERINQDMARDFPNVITHVKHMGQWHEVIHSDLFGYLERAAQRATHVRAFREVFPNTDQGRADFRKLIEKMRTELTPEVQRDLDGLVRAMNGHPTDDYSGGNLTDLLRMGPSQAGGVIARTMNQTLNNLMAKMVLTSQLAVQPGEVIFGSAPSNLGWKNYLRGMARARSLYDQMEITGMVNRVMRDYTFNPNSPVRSAFKMAGNIISKATLSDTLNEMQEAVAAATAWVVTERIQQGNLSQAEQEMLPNTFRDMGFSPAEVRQMMRGDPNLLGQFRRKAAAYYTSGNKSLAEGSRIGSNRLFNSIFRFQSYPMMKMNQARNILTNWIEAERNGTRQQAQSRRRQVARFMFGNTMQGAFTVMLTSLAFGGMSGLKIRKEEAEDEPFRFLLESFLASMSGPFYILWRGARFAGGKGVAEQAARAAFPYSIMSELNDMASGNGKYKDTDEFGRIGKFLESKTPATKMISTGLAMSGLTQDNQKLEQAIQGLSRWKIRELGFDERESFRRNDERKEFRTQMKAAVKAMQEGDEDAYRDAWSKAVDAQGLDAVRDSLRRRKLLVDLDGKELTEELKEKLQNRIGMEAYETLEYYDMMMDAAAEGSPLF